LVVTVPDFVIIAGSKDLIGTAPVHQLHGEIIDFETHRSAAFHMVPDADMPFAGKDIVQIRCKGIRIGVDFGFLFGRNGISVHRPVQPVISGFGDPVGRPDPQIGQPFAGIQAGRENIVGQQIFLPGFIADGLVNGPVFAVAGFIDSVFSAGIYYRVVKREIVDPLSVERARPVAAAVAGFADGPEFIGAFRWQGGCPDGFLTAPYLPREGNNPVARNRRILRRVFVPANATVRIGQPEIDPVGGAYPDRIPVGQDAEPLVVVIAALGRIAGIDLVRYRPAVQIVVLIRG